jgi:hypothetical protein
VTYTFQIPTGASGLVAQYRYSASESWRTLPEKTAADFFNGEQLARFDYPNRRAYLSVAFAQASDNIFIRALNGQQEVGLLYLGIPLYYDNEERRSR